MKKLKKGTHLEQYYFIYDDGQRGTKLTFMNNFSAY